MAGWARKKDGKEESREEERQRRNEINGGQLEEVRFAKLQRNRHVQIDFEDDQHQHGVEGAAKRTDLVRVPLCEARLQDVRKDATGTEKVGS